MKNTYTVMIDDVHYVSMGRSNALWKCIYEHFPLQREFMKTIEGSVMSMTPYEYDAKVEEFIREKGLRILNEKPVVRIKDDHFVVDVYYTITW